jgi:hypothetical protein
MVEVKITCGGGHGQPRWWRFLALLRAGWSPLRAWAGSR